VFSKKSIYIIPHGTYVRFGKYVYGTSLQPRLITTFGSNG
jgi:hypothetical protein